MFSKQEAPLAKWPFHPISTLSLLEKWKHFQF
jgi:hypothetical protein